MNKTPLKISAREASNKTGYTTSYIASLCRAGKIQGEQIRSKWVIDSESLTKFAHEHTLQKKELARRLARERCEEYKRAQRTSLKKYPNKASIFVPKKEKGISVKVERAQKIPFKHIVTSGVALALAFVCTFSAYNATVRLFSINSAFTQASVATAPLVSFNTYEKDGEAQSATIDFIGKNIKYSYVHTGTAVYVGIIKSLDEYRVFILDSGKSALSMGVSLRDTGKKVALFTGEILQKSVSVPIRIYTRGIYAFVRVSPNITQSSGRAIFGLGNSIMRSVHTSVVATVILYSNVNNSIEKHTTAIAHENSGIAGGANLLSL